MDTVGGKLRKEFRDTAMRDGLVIDSFKPCGLQKSVR